MPSPDFSSDLANIDAAGLRRRRRTLESAQTPHLRADGRDWLSFCSNDYLGLAAHGDLVAAVTTAAARFGVGGGAAHLVSGHHQLHQHLEDELAQFMGRPCLLFAGGFAANTGILPALVGREDVILADKLVHASLIDGAQLSRATLRRFRHNDMEHLEQLLQAAEGKRRLIVADGVFSMDGDLAPLPAILALAEQYDAWVYVDDAHGFGVLGAEGRGTLEHFGLTSPRIIHLCTLGKAAGVAGAAVFAEQSVIDWLLQSARSYVFSTSSPPILAAALTAALRLIRLEPQRRQGLQKLIQQLRQGCADLPWSLLESPTAIQPLVIGSNQAALDVAAALAEHGIWVPAIRPPTVPVGTARLRITLTASHKADDVAQLLNALHCVAEAGVGQESGQASGQNMEQGASS